MIAARRHSFPLLLPAGLAAGVALALMLPPEAMAASGAWFSDHVVEPFSRIALVAWICG